MTEPNAERSEPPTVPADGPPVQPFPGGQSPAPDPGQPPAQHQAQAYPGQAYPAQAYPGQAYPAQAYPGQAYPAQVFAASPENPQGIAQPAEPPPRRRRTGLIISLVLAGVLTLCAGGGVGAFVLVQNAQPEGAAVPTAAIEGFLTAVFEDFSATDAAAHVCPDARDDQDLARLVAQVREFAERFEGPQTTWEYPPVVASGRQAEATVTLTLRTEYEQVATKQIRLLLVDDRGWWVCDAEAA